MARYPQTMKVHSAGNLDLILIFQTSIGQKSVHLIILETDQTAKRLEGILFGELSSLTPFSHSQRTRSVFTSMPIFSSFVHSPDYLIESR